MNLFIHFQISKVKHAKLGNGYEFHPYVIVHNNTGLKTIQVSDPLQIEMVTVIHLLMLATESHVI